MWDKERDASRYSGPWPVVAHPPCRAWGQLKQFAKPDPGEIYLAIIAVWIVRRCGGVLEHPFRSELWQHCDLPNPGELDAWGGWTMAAPQFWWGHSCNKSTKLYICGVKPKDAPAPPLVLGDAPRTMGLSSRRNRMTRRKEASKRERSATPPALAEWLVDLARKASR